MNDTGGRLTVLTTLRDILAVKTFTRGEDGSVQAQGYGLAKRFRAREVEVDDEGRWLRKLSRKKHSFVVLGQPVDWPDGDVRRRLSARDGDDEATLTDVPRLWMPIDIDQLNFVPEADIGDGEYFALEALDMLGLKNKQCIWHLTGSHGVEDRYRIRLWVKLAKPQSSASMKAFALERWGDLTVDVKGKSKMVVDTAVLTPAQPIYTGSPVFVGMDDPVDERVGSIAGEPLKIRAAPKQEKREKDEDPNIDLMRAKGLYIKPASKPGHHYMVCPWEDEHSGEAKERDTMYYEANFEGRDEPFFRCFHETCKNKERWWRDVEAKLGITPFEKVSEDEESEIPWVYIHRMKSFWDSRDGALIDKDMFDTTHGGKSKKGSPFDLFMANRKTTKVDAAEFLPSQDRIVTRGKIRVLNTYIDMRTEPDDADSRFFVDHAKFLIPDRGERDWVLDWMSWVYQHPGQKITWAPVLFGPQGTGKTSLLACLAECIGLDHVSSPAQAEIEEKFNDWCYGKLLVVIEELMCGERYELAERLKPIIANDRVHVRMMHKSGFSIKNTANVAACTNHYEAVPLERTDRRYMMVQCTEVNGKEHMEEFHDTLRRVGYGGIARFLGERDVSQFRPESEAPMTKLKLEMIESSKTEMERAIDACAILDKEELVTSELIYAVLTGDDEHKITVHPKKYGQIARARKWLGLPGQEGRFTVGYKRITVWSPIRHQNSIRALWDMEKPKRDARLTSIKAKTIFSSQKASERAKDLWDPDV